MPCCGAQRSERQGSLFCGRPGWSAGHGCQSAGRREHGGLLGAEQSSADVGRRLAVAARNDEDGGQLDLREPAMPAEYAGKQSRRERRGPASPTPGVPDRPAAPREEPNQGERGASGVAAMATTRPRHPPRAPADDTGQRRPEAPPHPRKHTEQPKDADRAGERARGGDGKCVQRSHVMWCIKRCGRRVSGCQRYGITC